MSSNETTTDSASKNKMTTLSPKKESLDIDELIEPLGGFGRFQILTLLQISVVFTCAGLSDISYVFTTGRLNHRCKIVECETDLGSFEQPWLISAIPTLKNGHPDSCKRYTVVNHTQSNCSSNLFTKEAIDCNKFIYDTDEWTIAREGWGINCESDQWRLNIIGSLYNAGAVLGTIFVGYFGDRFGRKVVILTLCMIVAVIGVIKSFAINYAMFATLEFIHATMSGGLYALPFVLALELVSPSKRLFAGCVMSCAYPLGEILVPLIQWRTYDWRTTLRIVHAPYIFVFMFFWVMPESPRWLLAKNKKEEIVKVLERIASTNGTTLCPKTVHRVMSIDSTKEESDSNGKRDQLIAAWKSKEIRFRYAKVLLLWVFMMFTYFGMNLSAVSISSNKFLDSILSSLVEFPSGFVACWLMAVPMIGRRFTLSGSFFLCTLGCLLYGYVPDDWYWPRLVLFLVGKFGIAISSLSLNVCTTELFPTTLRGTASATGHTVGRIASILAPEIPLLQTYYKPLPLLLFSLLATIAGTLTLTLPETLGTKLPHTVRDAELLGKNCKDVPRKISCSVISCHEP